jgi:hypothetical protein
MPSGAEAQGGACSQYVGSPPINREYVAFSGPWAKHGGSIDITVDGCGILEMRTYEMCRPGRQGIDPCDWIGNNLIHGGDWASFELNIKDGSAASGRVIVARDPARHVRPGIVLRLRDDGTLGVEWFGAERVFCRTWAWDTNVCGA